VKLDKALNIDDLRTVARHRLPRMVFDALDGGADDERSLRANRLAYDSITFRPRALVDVSERDQSTTVFGETISMPVMLSPTGSGRLACPGAELLLARESGKAGTIYAHGSVASYSAEDVAAASDGSLWYQLYLPPDRLKARKLIERVQAAGYRALVLTIDTPVRGNRERDARNQFSLPYTISPHLIAQGMSRPAWSAQFLRANARLPRWGKSAGTPRKSSKPAQLSLREVESSLIAARWPATWEDVEFVREVWQGPLLLKGIMRPDECDRIVSMGVDGIVVSNHGGRQLDGVPATIAVLPEIVDAVDKRAEVFVDGGIRRGTDVVKALALGARACFVGRPYIYALAAGRGPGLVKMFEMFRTEIDRAMALLGCQTIADIDRSLVTHSCPTCSTTPASTTLSGAGSSER